jgi:hypothetical protein
MRYLRVEEIDPMVDNPEARRLAESDAGAIPWKLWGPYLSERQWGTVREDYSPGGTAWDSFPHDHARSRAYRWGEDGMLGISDDRGLLCFAPALWNEADPILKERFFGLTGSEGNHGEDVKEYYYFLDNTPTHSYMKALYKYPQRAYPYADLVAENRRRGKEQPEYELIDTSVFAGDRYFDVTVEYAKAGPDDIVIRLSVTNRGPAAAPLHLLPTLWLRNTWSWGIDDYRPTMQAANAGVAASSDRSGPVVEVEHRNLGTYLLACDGAPELLFTENVSNGRRLWGVENTTPYVKDGIDDAVVNGAEGTVNPDGTGTKVAAHYRLTVAPGATETVTLRLSRTMPSDPFADVDAVFAQRRSEADAFYAGFGTDLMSKDARNVQRQAFAGMLWSKQFFYYNVHRWRQGDPSGPPPPDGHRYGRNAEWDHLSNADVISMPDTWEYPWYAAWDLAFHCIPLAMIDPRFAKEQLLLLLREWYMHPNGQLPAYEWAFGDVNPPVHAWAALRVWEIDKRRSGQGDLEFLKRVFHKLLLNFTWWVNRKDREGRNVFQGGFLGLDNIGVFDRSAPLPTGGYLEQADGTAWMGMYCLNMLAIAIELARQDAAYEDVATKFFEHFLYIAGAINDIGGMGISLWDEEDQFFYDVLRSPNGEARPLKVHSLVGLIPLLAVETLGAGTMEQLSSFSSRMDWFLENRPDLAALVSRWREPGAGESRLLALVRGHRMKRLLRRMLDPEEFLSDYGIRAISRYHRDHPYVLEAHGMEYRVDYTPAESTSGLFGGNSNWRGPIWFPINYLLIEALRTFHRYYGDDFLVESPTDSGELKTLGQVADDLSRRLSSIFLRDADGRRPVFGRNDVFQLDPYWRDHVLFHEYFHGDTGAGVGANHQTGWTGVVAALLETTAPRSTVQEREVVAAT